VSCDSYEPELHPGVTYRLKSPKACLKIFSTGSITVTGNVHIAVAVYVVAFVVAFVLDFLNSRLVLFY